MSRPNFVTYLLGVVLAAIAGYLVFRGVAMTSQFNSLTIPIFVTCLLPMTAILVFGPWDLPKNHPLSLPLGLIMFGLLLTTIFSWVCWSQHEEFLKEWPFRTIATVVAFMVSSPGLLRWIYVSRVKNGDNAAVIATALVDEDESLRIEAANRLGRMTLFAATPAVPLLLYATTDPSAMVSLKAREALRKLGCPAAIDD